MLKKQLNYTIFMGRISFARLEVCKETLEDLMKLTTLTGQNLDYIKNATKQAYFALRDGSDSPIERWKKLYEFLGEGITIASRDEGRTVQQHALQGIISHMLSYKGDVASELFERTRDIEWAKKGHNDYMETIQAERELDFPGHASRVVDSAISLTDKALEQTKNIEYWGTKMFMISHEFLARFNLEYVASMVKKLEQNWVSSLFEATGNPDYAGYWYATARKKAEEGKIELPDFVKELEIEGVGLSARDSFTKGTPYVKLGDLAAYFYKRTGKEEWAKEVQKEYKFAAKIDTEASYSLAEKFAFFMFNKTSNPVWEQKGKECRTLGEKRAREARIARFKELEQNKTS